MSADLVLRALEILGICGMVIVALIAVELIRHWIVEKLYLRRSKRKLRRWQSERTQNVKRGA